MSRQASAPMSTVMRSATAGSITSKRPVARITVPATITPTAAAASPAKCSATARTLRSLASTL